jgi:hypothetical protein
MKTNSHKESFKKSDRTPEQDEVIQYRNDCYLTNALRPEHEAGPNSHGAKTEGEWIRRECDARLKQGQKVVVVIQPDGCECLTYRHNIAKPDKVVYPKAAESLTRACSAEVDTLPSGDEKAACA